MRSRSDPETPETTALVFPGQGSQRSGMAKDFHDNFEVARDAFAEASEAAGIELTALCFGHGERLHLTEFTQPAIVTAEVAMLRVLEQKFALRADVFAGHSLGEYTALVAAGVLALADAVRLVRRRGALMQQAVPAGEGAMLAVIGEGLDIEAVRAKIADLEVDAANHNSPTQIVVSGRAGDVAKARERFEIEGRRCVPLEVSAPFHSRFMKGIEKSFAEALAGVSFSADGAMQVSCNYTGGFHEADAASMRESLVRQISGTVLWMDNMNEIAQCAERVIEIGPGRPLSAFFREVGVKTLAIRTVKEAEKALG